MRMRLHIFFPLIIFLFFGNWSHAAAFQEGTSNIKFYFVEITKNDTLPLPDVEIFADSDSVGKTDSTGTYFLDKIKLGLHKFRFKKSGFKTLEVDSVVKGSNPLYKNVLERVFSLRIEANTQAHLIFLKDDHIEAERKSMPESQSWRIAVTNGAYRILAMKEWHSFIDTTIAIENDDLNLALHLDPIEQHLTEELRIQPKAIDLIYRQFTYKGNLKTNALIPAKTNILQVKCDVPIEGEVLKVFFNHNDVSTYCKRVSGDEIQIERIEDFDWQQGLNILHFYFKDRQGLTKFAHGEVEGIVDKSPVIANIDSGTIAIDSTLSADGRQYFFRLKNMQVWFRGPVDTKNIRVYLNQYNVTNYFTATDSTVRHNAAGLQNRLLLSERNRFEFHLPDRTNQSAGFRLMFDYPRPLQPYRYRIVDILRSITVISLETDIWPLRETDTYDNRTFGIAELVSFQAGLKKRKGRIFDTFKNVDLRLSLLRLGLFSQLPFHDDTERDPDRLSSALWLSYAPQIALSLGLWGNRGFAGASKFGFDITGEAEYLSKGVYLEPSANDIPEFGEARIGDFVRWHVSFRTINLALYEPYGSAFSWGLAYNSRYPGGNYPRYRIELSQPVFIRRISNLDHYFDFKLIFENSFHTNSKFVKLTVNYSAQKVSAIF